MRRGFQQYTADQHFSMLKSKLPRRLPQSYYYRYHHSMKVGILTGGGDCPGLNAVIRAVVRKGIFHFDDEFVGFLEGWRGVLEDQTIALNLNAVAGILPRGGTILRTSRTNPTKKEGGVEQCLNTIKKHALSALIVIGGDDTQSVAKKLLDRGCPI